MLKRLITGIIVASAVSAVADAISKSKKKPETNEHDTEKETFLSLPINEEEQTEKAIFQSNPIPTISQIQGQHKVSFSQLQCTSCGADIDIDDDLEFIYCKYCGNKIYIHDDPNVRIAKKQLDTYKQIELSKQQNYKDVVVAREARKASETKTMFLFFAFLIAVYIILGIIFVFYNNKNSAKNQQSNSRSYFTESFGGLDWELPDYFKKNTLKSTDVYAHFDTNVINSYVWINYEKLNQDFTLEEYENAKDTLHETFANNLNAEIINTGDTYLASFSSRYFSFTRYDAGVKYSGMFVFAYNPDNDSFIGIGYQIPSDAEENDLSSDFIRIIKNATITKT